MFRVLLESNAPRQRRRASTAASIAVHTVVIAGAIVATASARTGAAHRDGNRDKIHILLPPDPPSQRRPEAPRSVTQEGPERRSEGILPTAPRIPDFVVRSPERADTDIDVGSLLATDTILPLEPTVSGRAHGGGPTASIGDEPATLATVERAAALLAPAKPRYPDQLRAAGVTGRVVVRLVVDTAGRVEPATVVIREASHDLFAYAVRAILPSLRFTPAEVGGRKVRMLVELPFEFRLNE